MKLRQEPQLEGRGPTAVEPDQAKPGASGYLIVAVNFDHVSAGTLSVKPSRSVVSLARIVPGPGGRLDTASAVGSAVGAFPPVVHASASLSSSASDSDALRHSDLTVSKILSSAVTVSPL